MLNVIFILIGCQRCPFIWRHDTTSSLSSSLRDSEGSIEETITFFFSSGLGLFSNIVTNKVLLKYQTTKHQTNKVFMYSICCDCVADDSFYCIFYNLDRIGQVNHEQCHLCGYRGRLNSYLDPSLL